MRSRGTRRWRPTPAVQTLRKPGLSRRVATLSAAGAGAPPLPAAAGPLHLASVPRFLR